MTKKELSENKELSDRNKELEAKLAKNSSNSGKPPASDGLKKPPKTASQRKKSGKKPGGQEGHKGKTLEQVETPDRIEKHSASNCQCGQSLEEVEGVCTEKRQVFDLLEPKMEITEHQIEAKKCPCCGEITKGHFPKHVTAQVQYGERVKALSVYFAHQHYIPSERLSQIFEDIFGIKISPGTCANIDKKLYKQLEIFEKTIKKYLTAEKVLHLDETGMRCNKKLHWIHVASSEKATFYGIHKRRGKEAIDEFDILPKFNGYAIHDHWKPYFSYEQVKHGLCNAHHLRDLAFVMEHEKEQWAKKMKDLLLSAKKEIAQRELSEMDVNDIKQRYGKIVLEGYGHHLEQGPLEEGKNKQRFGKNLLDRFAQYYECVLRFVTSGTPFTNNRGEQDIRMVKLKQKISGCFRRIERGQIFCRIRSYISTARKQGWTIWDALADAVRGEARLLSSPTLQCQES